MKSKIKGMNIGEVELDKHWAQDGQTTGPRNQTAQSW